MTLTFEGWNPLGFPKIGMTIDGKEWFKSLSQAVPFYDSGWSRVELTGKVLLSDFSVREMTPEESSKLSDLADEYSASK